VSESAAGRRVTRKPKKRNPLMSNRGNEAPIFRIRVINPFRTCWTADDVY
jgi:hypothetical protein